ncbi:MAG: nitronate monooxygenase, partial [Anaerolineae bacterium]
MEEKKVLRTKVCDMLGIEYPIFLAGMGQLTGNVRNMRAAGGANPKLVAAVSNAGGLGVLGATGVFPDALREQIREIKSLTDEPFGVDLLLPQAKMEMPAGVSIEKIRAEMIPPEHEDFVEEMKRELNIPEPKGESRLAYFAEGLNETVAKKQVEVCLEEEVALFASALGMPEWLVPMCHEAETKVLGLAGNVRAALRHKAAGADIIVAQGHEAGGHTGRIGTLALVPQVVDAVSPIPVLAAGGIGDGRGVVAALALGAAGVWVGTYFLFAREANTSQLSMKLMIEATEEDTAISRI